MLHRQRLLLFTLVDSDAIKGISVQNGIFMKITSTQVGQNSVQLLSVDWDSNEFGTEA